MRVDDSVIDGVCFVEAEWSGVETKVGSAFFVGVRLGIGGAHESLFTYVVTSRHCIENRTGQVADKVKLSLNLLAGGIGEIVTQPASWRLHSTADVAILPIGYLDRDRFKFKLCDLSTAATKEFIEERRIGSGDDVFILGLLVHHPGKTQIMPIARIGNIAAMPTDAVQLITGNDVVVLIEARSIGGLSGSPVYLHLPFWRDQPAGTVSVVNDPKGAVADSGGEHRLLGVMHGFYPVGTNDPDGVSGGDENLNTGIAVVVLADRIIELISHPDLQHERNEMKRKLEGQLGLAGPAND